jgi:hypothetical protein
LDAAATENGWSVDTETLPDGVGKVEYTKDGGRAVLLWDIAERYARKVTLDGAEQHGSGALIALRRFLEGKDPDDGVGVIEAEGQHAWYAGSG